MSAFIPDKLKMARIKAGLSLHELAESLPVKISRQALHKYERGDVAPDSTMIGHLAAVLGVSRNFFFLDSDIELEKIEFRKHNNLSARDQDRIIQTIKDDLTSFLELESISGIIPQFTNPIFDFAPIESFNDIEEASLKVRHIWKIGDDSISNCMDFLESNSIRVLEIDTVDEFDGLQAWETKYKIPIISINRSFLKTDDRLRFTLMHELGHLILKFENKSDKEIEKYCNQFAASILFPAESMIRELGSKRHKLSIQELAALKQKFGMSMQAIVMRAKDLEIITENYCKQFFNVIRQLGWKNEEPIDYQGNEKSTRMDRLLYRALAENLINIEKAAEIKKISVHELKQYLFFT